MRRPDELITRIVVGRPGPVHAFHKIAKRPHDDISSVAVAYDLTLADGVVERVRIGPWRRRDAPARVRHRGGVDRPPLDGRDPPRAASEVLAGEGTPLDDHRGQRRLPAGHARHLAGAVPAGEPGHPGGELDMVDTSDWDSAVVEPAPTEDRLPAEARRPNPHHGAAQRPTSLVGTDVAHDNAISHVTGTVHYTEDLAAGVAGVLHAWPVQAPIARGRIASPDASAALAAPGVVRVLTIDLSRAPTRSPSPATSRSSTPRSSTRARRSAGCSPRPGSRPSRGPSR